MALSRPWGTRRRNLILGCCLALVAVLMVLFSQVLYVGMQMACEWAGIGFSPNRPRTGVEVVPSQP